MSANRNTRVRIELGSVQEPLAIALWCRAVENEKRNPYLRDPKELGTAVVPASCLHGGEQMERSIAAFSLAVSVFAFSVGALCIFIALITAFTHTPLLALTSTYIQLGIAAFLAGVWFALLALIYDARSRGTGKT